MYTRILVATDGSKTAALALEEACKLARGAEVRVLQREGQRVGRAIVMDDAARWPADVIGSHGRQGPEELLIGSVADGVARIAGIPVLLVRAR